MQALSLQAVVKQLFNGIPILGIDVWEHAYFLKYQNKRADYVNTFFNLTSWKVAEERYLAARSKAALV